MKNRGLKDLQSEIQETISFDQPSLKVTPEADHVSVTGTYAVKPEVDDHLPQGSLKKYKIEIHFPGNFPIEEPRVWETGGEIKKCEDFHVNVRDGSCCINIWELWVSSTETVSVQTYFDGPLRNFFLGQYMKKLTGKWLFGEEAHGTKGVVLALAKRFQCQSDEQEIRRFLKCLSKSKVKGHWPCPCGKSARVRDCCLERIVKIKESFSEQNAQQLLAKMKS